MAQLVGPARAKMIFMGGEKIDAKTALAWGLFDKVVEKDVLMDEVRTLSEDTLGATPDHAAAIKAMIKR